MRYKFIESRRDKKNSSQRLNYQRAFVFLFLLSVFLLALCKVEDGDAWMHLSLGKVIWQLKGLPATEPYVYTALDRPFSYSAWLFGFIYYLSYLAFNIYGVILLKAITVTTAFYILLRDSLRPYKNYIISIIVMTIVVIMVRHRFVERPDTFMMVFLSFSIFSLNAYVYDNKKYIYALPFIHMLWANSHSSIILMFIPFGAFIAGGVLQGYMNRKLSSDFFPLSPSQIKTIIIIFIASFAASLINPFFISQYFYGTESLATSWIKQEVLEVQPPTWQTNKWPYLMTALIVLSFILNRKRFSFIHFFIGIPFIVLSFAAFRFVFILGIVSGPLLARNISAYLLECGMRNADNAPSKAVTRNALRVTCHDISRGGRGSYEIRNLKSEIVVAVWIILYTTLSLMQVKPFNTPRQAFDFGFGINYDSVPERALRYMDRNGITGRVFNEFWGGEYINWRDFPKRSVFVDPRWEIPCDLLEKMYFAVLDISILDELEERFGFESIMIRYPDIQSNPEIYSDVDVGISRHPYWALVYWDDRSLLYLKRGGRYDPIIQKDEYRFVRPASGIYSVISKLHDESYRGNIIREVRRNITETGSSKAYTFLGFIYNETGQYNDAIEAFSKVRHFPFPFLSRSSDAYNGIAHAYEKLGYPDEAIRYYKKSLSMEKDAETLYNIGELYQKNDKKTAKRYLEDALRLNPNLTSIYPPLIRIYQEFDMKDDVADKTKMYEKAKLIKMGEDYFINGIKAYKKGRYESAVKEYQTSIKSNPLNPAPYVNLGFIYIDINMFDKAYEYLKKAIDIDYGFADAHYGLALIYKARGDIDTAKKHWKEYLRIKPAGYYSRMAVREMESSQSTDIHPIVISYDN
ncbi:MAG: tetratricopeptide repeat protein [Nitrospirae bacterium]|nr:tetratricopeptide repeat protein [Nitrospirota bacterium]